MKKKNKEKILVGLVMFGLLLIAGAIGGMENEIISLTKGISIFFVGLIVIAAVIYYCNREEKFPLTFSNDLKNLRKILDKGGF